MNALFQPLSEQDVPALLDLMREFYMEQQMGFDEKAAAAAVAKLIHDSSLGEIYFIFRGAQLAGYFAVTFCFSLEFHGRFALLDELYLRETFRRRKLGEAAVAFVESICKKTGIEALRLEVGRRNSPAQALYRSAGFAQEGRFLFTKWL